MLGQVTDARGTEGRRADNGSILRSLRIGNVGNGLLRIDRPVANLRMEDVDVRGAYRVIENLPRRGLADASFVGLIVDDVRAVDLQRGFARIGSNSRGGRFSDIVASGTVHNEDIPCGMMFEGRAHDFELRRCVMRGFRMNLPGTAYQNGDGFSTERGNYGFRFLNCEAYDNSDGGFDLKSTGTFLDGCISGGNKYNYRFWSPVQAHVLTSLTPVRGPRRAEFGHFSLTGEPPVEIHIARLVIRSSVPAPLFTVHRGRVRVVIDSHDIRTPPGTPMLIGEGQGDIVWRSGPPRL